MTIDLKTGLPAAVAPAQPGIVAGRSKRQVVEGLGVQGFQSSESFGDGRWTNGTGGSELKLKARFKFLKVQSVRCQLLHQGSTSCVTRCAIGIDV